VCTLVSHTKRGTYIEVFENKVLRILGPKREKVAGGWRGLHNEELHNLCVSPNIIRVVKLGKMSWVWHVACMREVRNAYKIWSENLMVRGHLEDTGIDEEIILDWIIGK
jgi:hypothetical protein